MLSMVGIQNKYIIAFAHVDDSGFAITHLIIEIVKR